MQSTMAEQLSRREQIFVSAWRLGVLRGTEAVVVGSYACGGSFSNASAIEKLPCLGGAEVDIHCSPEELYSSIHSSRSVNL